MMDRQYTSGGAPDWSLIPPHMHEGLKYYVEKGVKPGSFLMAILRNDFMDAAGRADETNRRALHQYAKFFYMYLPRDCYGSPENVENWLKKGGLDGLRKEV